MIKAVLFDLDGTLLDTSEGIKQSVRYTLSEMRYCALPENTILKFVGPPIQNSLMNYCGASLEEAQKGANVFRNHYKAKAMYEASLYDGITELLLNLKSNGVKIGVATYKREDYAIDLLKYFGIDKYCDAMHGADNENILSKADIIEMCISEMGVRRNKVVLVGDTEHDAKGAFQAKVSFIAVTWGFGYKINEVDSQFPVYSIANAPKDIIGLLN